MKRFLKVIDCTQQLHVRENVVGFEKALGAVKVIKDQIQYRSQSLLNLARDYFRLWLNDNAMFYKTLFRRNYKEISAHLRDKHFECCIFNIVQHHQTFVNKD